MRKDIRLFSTSRYPCQWDDLIDKKNKVCVTVYTLGNTDKFDLKYLKKEGINFNKKDGIYDVVIDASRLNKFIIKKWLEKLNKISKSKYILE